MSDEVAKEIQEIIGESAEYEFERTIGFFKARKVVEALNASGFVIVHKSISPYKEQEYANQTLAAVRKDRPA